ncbi:MAG: CRISPR-associated protein Cas4 [Ignavibacteriales bacterium]|nr:CRISPR-associated protein Cas4 [Ignavibacteriales bacterium]
MITGTHINYYYVCKRELWLFTHGLQMEQTSDLVYLGKVIDESSYSREEKGIDIDGVINIDWLDDKTGIIHEVKKSDSVEKAHEMQVRYYLWYLKHKGIKIADNKYQMANDKLQMADGKIDEYQDDKIGLRGEIDYPKLKQKTTVILTEQKEKELLKAMEDIERIIASEKPPERLNKKFCKTCSYYELCWS